MPGFFKECKSYPIEQGLELIQLSQCNHRRGGNRRRDMTNNNINIKNEIFRLLITGILFPFAGAVLSSCFYPDHYLPGLIPGAIAGAVLAIVYCSISIYLRYIENRSNEDEMNCRMFNL